MRKTGAKKDIKAIFLYTDRFWLHGNFEKDMQPALEGDAPL